MSEDKKSKVEINEKELNANVFRSYNYIGTKETVAYLFNDWSNHFNINGYSQRYIWDVVKIDFGISASASAEQSVPAATLGYAAPEIFTENTIDVRADIYSFGYVLRYLFTGLTPSEKTETPTAELVSDRKIAAVINRCTARNPEERFSSVREITEFLFPTTRH